LIRIPTLQGAVRCLATNVEYAPRGIAQGDKNLFSVTPVKRGADNASCASPLL
jgi:hypothetical protein